MAAKANVNVDDLVQKLRPAQQAWVKARIGQLAAEQMTLFKDRAPVLLAGLAEGDSRRSSTNKKPAHSAHSARALHT